MGQLVNNKSTLSWKETKKINPRIRSHGITEFIEIYKNASKYETKDLRCGDEIEYMLFDDKMNIAPLGNDLLEKTSKEVATWNPEFARYMIESSPRSAYPLSDIKDIEKDMRKRREHIKLLLPKGYTVLTIVAYPLLGAKTMNPESNPASLSDYVSDALINRHARFSTLARNIRERRGSKVDIQLPVFRDTRTPFGNVQMDAMAFGMGCCCLQATLSFENLSTCRYVYDQLAVLAPLFLSLTAASPVFKGRLTAHDCRWNVISGSVDDRTLEERGESSRAQSHSVLEQKEKQMLADRPTEKKSRIAGSKNNKKVKTTSFFSKSPQEREDSFHLLAKSRFSSIDYFLAEHKAMREEYNDVPAPYEDAYYTRMLESGVDERMARHVASLFVRDAMVAYENVEEQLATLGTSCFENIQTSNWRSVRLKIPNTVPVWCVEFRTMEVQPTDFENAAFFSYVVLLAHTIVAFNLALYIPMSLVDENFKIAIPQGSAVHSKFNFRVNIEQTCARPRLSMLTLDAIINGEANFKGLSHYVRAFINKQQDNAWKTTMHKYVDFVSKKANGTYRTVSSWMREYITSHSDYKKDSIVSEKIALDLLNHISKITEKNSTDYLLK